MLRSCIYNIGLFVVLCGAALLYVDAIVLNVQEEVVTLSAEQPPSNSFRGMFTSTNPDGKKVLVPPPWEMA